MLDVAHVQDVGRAINPTLCEGQMRGGVAQSIGYALFEELVHDEDGMLTNATFLGYAMPAGRAPAGDRHGHRRGAFEARPVRRQGNRGVGDRPGRGRRRERGPRCDRRPVP